MNGWEFMWACIIVFLMPPVLSAILSMAATVTVGIRLFEDDEGPFFWGSFTSITFLLFIIACGLVFYE